MVNVIPLTRLSIQDDGIHLVIRAGLGDAAVRLLIDTGASRTVFDRDFVLNTFRFTEKDLQHNPGPSGGIGTTSLESSIAQLPVLRLGDLVLVSYVSALIDLGQVNSLFASIGLPGVEGILGGDILERYSAVIDYGKGVLKLYEGRRLKKPGNRT